MAMPRRICFCDHLWEEHHYEDDHCMRCSCTGFYQVTEQVQLPLPGFDQVGPVVLGPEIQ